jgi:hypothetical protein
MRGRFSRIAAASLGLAMASIGILGIADPAHAASLPICTGTTAVYSYGGTYVAAIPSLGNGTSNWQCEHRLGAGYNFATGQGTRDGIKALQATINRCYGDERNWWWRLRVDGEYGGNTTEAVRWVQGQIGVGVDGKAGPITRSHMVWAFYHVDTGQDHCASWT